MLRVLKPAEPNRFRRAGPNPDGPAPGSWASRSATCRMPAPRRRRHSSGATQKAWGDLEERVRTLARACRSSTAGTRATAHARRLFEDTFDQPSLSARPPTTRASRTGEARARRAGSPISTPTVAPAPSAVAARLQALIRRPRGRRRPTSQRHIKRSNRKHWDAVAAGRGTWFDWTERNFAPLRPGSATSHRGAQAHACSTSRAALVILLSPRRGKCDPSVGGSPPIVASDDQRSELSAPRAEGLDNIEFVQRTAEKNCSSTTSRSTQSRIRLRIDVPTQPQRILQKRIECW